MINAKMQEALNKQIQAEFFSSYLYLSMSAFCHSINLKGFASWMVQQAKEEQTHAMKLFDHLIERGGRANLLEIEKPQSDFKSALDVFQKTLEHEQKVTSLINKLYAMSIKEDDYPLQVLLQWFISEQVEEEGNATEILEKLKLIGEKSGAILYIDKELGKRE